MDGPGQMWPMLCFCSPGFATNGQGFARESLEHRRTQSVSLAAVEANRIERARPPIKRKIAASLMAGAVAGAASGVSDGDNVRGGH